MKSLSILFIALALICSCSSTGTDDSDSEPGTSTSANVFPHPSLWSSVDSHGVTTYNLYAEGTDASMGDSCFDCHETDLTGASTESLCFECHQNFPHLTGWTDSGNSNFHGSAITSDTVTASCATQCHGTDLSGGLSNKACNDCHASYPHTSSNVDLSSWFTSTSSDWADANVHGSYVNDSNAIAQGTCATACHGTDYSGGVNAQACTTCHATFPHTSYDDWTTSHQSHVSLSGDQSCSSATGCHSTSNLGPDTVVQSCTDTCH